MMRRIKMAVPILLLCGLALTGAMPRAWAENTEHPGKNGFYDPEVRQRIAELEKLRREDPPAFERLVGQRKAGIRRRLGELRKKNPREFREIRQRVSRHRLHHLEKMRREHPERFREIMRHRGERMLEFRKRHPERFRRYLERHPRAAVHVLGAAERERRRIRRAHRGRA